MIWLVGCRGMLGTELGLALDAAGLAWQGTDRELDAADLVAVRSFVTEHKPAWIINCAAYTAVDKAEDADQRDLCLRLNETIPHVLGTVAAEHNARVLHISTDYVFDGHGIPGPDGALRPYLPSDPVAPTGWYGETKARGEAALLAACNTAVILRTAWLYGLHGPNFVYTMLRLMKERDSIGVVADQYGSPTWALDLAQAIVSILAHSNPTAGIYHYSGTGKCTWYEFACEIYKQARAVRILDKECIINPLGTNQYPTKAVRPAWSVLDKTDVISMFGIQIPDWRKSLATWFSMVTQYWDDKVDLVSMSVYDLETASHMLDSGRYLYVFYTAQQAVEKALKARICLFANPRRIHDISQLAEQAALSLDAAESTLAKMLSKYYLKYRYPEDFKMLLDTCTRELAENMLQGAKELCGRILKHPLL